MFYQLFPITSRYHSTETTTIESQDGRLITYLRRRFLPDPNQFAVLQEHQVSGGERPDHLAARYLNDPEQFWRLADANAVMRPEELTEKVGNRVRITLPEGLPGLPE